LSNNPIALLQESSSLSSCHGGLRWFDGILLLIDKLGDAVIIGIAVAGAVLLLAVIATLVILLAPSIRKKVMPHRDRTHFHVST